VVRISPLRVRTLSTGVFLFGLLVGGGASCDRAPAADPAASDAVAPTRFRLDAISADVRPSPSARAEWLTSAMAAEKLRTGMVTAPNWGAAGSGAAMRAEVTVQLVDEPGHERAVYLLFDAEVRAQRPGVLDSPFRLERTRAMLRDAVDRERVEFEIVDFGRLLADALVLQQGSDERVLDGLVDPRREYRVVALREVERRRLTRATVRVEELLDVGELDQFAAAAMALVGVGSEVSTRVVVERVDRAQSPALLLAVLPVLPRLPGGEGLAYATMVASGHPDASIRALAAESVRNAGR
jgi:hypothetical protein